MAQRMPRWVNRLPKADNDTYYYLMTYGSGNTWLKAYENATTQLFARATQRIGVVVDADDISRALAQGGSVEMLSQQFRLPINVVCEYHRKDPGGRGFESRLLAQVSKAGNIDVNFTEFRNCEEHLSEPVPYVDSELSLNIDVLSGGTDGKYAVSTLREDDYFYVSFLSSRSGYISVWLEDEDGTFLRLLPFAGSQPVQIEGNRSYVFFADQTEDIDGGMQYQVTVGGSRRQEQNTVHVIYSPYNFLSPNMRANGRGIPQSARQHEFADWLEQLRSRNPGTQDLTKKITIIKK